MSCVPCASAWADTMRSGWSCLTGVLAAGGILLVSLSLPACAGSPAPEGGPAGSGSGAASPQNGSTPAPGEAARPVDAPSPSPTGAPAGLETFSASLAGLETLATRHALVFDLSLHWAGNAGPGLLPLKLVLVKSGPVDPADPPVVLSGTVQPGAVQAVFGDLTSLELDVPYTWQLGVPGSDGALQSRGELLIPAAAVRDQFDRLAETVRLAVARHYGLGPEAALLPRLAWPGEGQQAPAGLAADLADLAGLPAATRFRLVPATADRPAWLEFNVALPSGLRSGWYPGLAVLEGQPVAGLPLFPADGAALIGSRWYFFWPALPDQTVSFACRYRVRGQPEQQWSRAVPGSGLVLSPGDLGIPAASSLEYLAWQLDLGPAGRTSEQLVRRFLNLNEPVPVFEAGQELIFPLGRDQGAPDERPRRQVRLHRAFALAREPVDNQLAAEIWNRALAAGLARVAEAAEIPGSMFLVDRSGRRLVGCRTLDFGSQTGLSLAGAPGSWLVSPVVGKEKHPLVGISWWGGLLFSDLLSLAAGLEPAYDPWTGAWRAAGSSSWRLPLETEWEAVASAGLGWPAPWGQRIDPSTANYDRSRDPYEDLQPPYNAKGGPTVPVQYYRERRAAAYPKASTARSPLLLTNPWTMDMVGNVWEWCQDWYQPKRYETMPDSLAGEAPAFAAADLDELKLRGLKPSRVVRGGAWNSRLEDLYAQNRGSFVPEATSHSIGLRLARTLEPPPADRWPQTP